MQITDSLFGTDKPNTFHWLKKLHNCPTENRCFFSVREGPQDMNAAVGLSPLKRLLSPPQDVVNLDKMCVKEKVNFMA